jgi:FlaA1/EpsC-like NDP-sugar epimerase
MPILSLPRLAKRLLVFGVDASLCVLTVWLSYYLRMGEFVSLLGEPLIAVSISLILALPIFVVKGLYRAIFRYSGWPALLTVANACLIYGLAYASIIVTMGFQGVPRTLGFIQPILLLFFIGLTRATASYWLGNSYRQQLKLGTVPRVLIYGAGSAGRQLSAALLNSHQMRVVGFIDDSKELQGQVLNGVKIFPPDEISSLANSLNISDVLLALPSVSRQRRNAILDLISKSKLAVRTLPSVTDLAQGKVTASDIKELDIEDLLGREPVAPDTQLMSENITNKIVLVTGAGGSIGSELCRQILLHSPVTLVLLEQNEFSLYRIEQELRSKLSQVTHTKLVPILASVRNEVRIHDVMQSYCPHIVFHAAAYKHVPLVEENPAEGIDNNVFGTYVVAQAAKNARVSRFVFISTDKAVRPTNVMGATKRLAEMILQAMAEHSNQEKGTIFSMVRFGNVLDSSGSVVPLFRKQIHNGGPVTVTHADVTRYFMTIPEAAQLVIQAGSMARGGEVFLLDMGEPVRIAELAKHMIELSGLEVKDDQNPEGDIAIEITGLRPGEKLYEELLIDNHSSSTKHPKIFKANEKYLSLEELQINLDKLKRCINEEKNYPSEIYNYLRILVNGYLKE